MLSYGSFVWLAQWAGADAYAAQRFVNVLLHLAAAGAIGLLTHALLRQWQLEQARQPARSALDEALDRALSPQELQARSQAAWLVALGWFALNPVAVYATGYLIQRSVLMATLFAALACWAWVRALQSDTGRAWAWGGLAVLCAGLAFLSKEHAVLLPLLAVPLYIYVRRPALPKVLLVLALASVAVAVLAALLWGRFGHLIGATAFDETSRAYVRELERLHPGAGAHAYVLSVLNQAGLFFRYLGYWLVPYVGSMSIDMRPVFPLVWTSPVHLAGALGFVVAGLWSVWALLMRRDGLSLLGLCILCVMLLFGTEFMTTWIQDPFVLYRSYLWAMFLPVGLAWAFTALPRKLIYGFGAVAVLALAALSYERLDSFKTPYTVWHDAARKVDLTAPAQAFGRWRPFMNRGSYYLEHENAQAALADFERAIALGEPAGSAQFSRGMALQLLGRYQEAVQAFHAAEKQGLQDPALYYQAAVSLRAMGAAQNALAALDEGAKHGPDALIQEHMLLLRAEIYTAGGAHQQAQQAYQALLQTHPDNGKYLVGLGMAHLAQNQHAQALAQFDKALALREDSAAYFARSLLHSRSGHPTDALSDARKALALAPDNPLYQQTVQQLEQAQPQLGPLRQRP